MPNTTFDVKEEIAVGRSGARLFLAAPHYLDFDAKSLIVFPEEHKSNAERIRIAARGEFLKNMEPSAVPQIFISDPMPYRWYQGKKVPLTIDLSSQTLPKQFGRQLHLLHGEHMMSGRETLVHRLTGLTKFAPPGFLKELLHWSGFVQVLAKPKGECICHNDLFPDVFFVEEDGVKIFDWGSADVGDPFFDLATVTQFLFYKPDLALQKNSFLRAYFGRKLADAEWAKLRVYEVATLLVYGLTFAKSGSVSCKEDTFEILMARFFARTKSLEDQEFTSALSRCFLKKVKDLMNAPQFEENLKIVREAQEKKSILYPV